MPPIIDEKKCTCCGTCIDVCPLDVFYGSNQNETPSVNYPSECWHCNSCVLECPVEGALRLRIPLTSMVLFK